MFKRYTGWVPTVTGNLSFSAIGVSKFPKKEYKCYRNIGDKKLTLVVQDRTTSDRIIPRKESPIGKFVFIALLISKKDTQHNENMGYVFVLPSIDFWRFEYLIQSFLSEKHFDDFARQINSLVSALATTEKAKKYVTETRISLLRNGKLTIDVDDNVQEDIPGTLANQVFYFVRDITHIHQHHEATSDTILKAYNTDKLFKENSNWKRETLYALYKFIIILKRSKKEKLYIRAKGILAYAQAFESLHIKNPKKDNVPNYLNHELLSSLDAAQMEKSNSRISNESIFVILLPIFIFLISFSISFANDAHSQSYLSKESVYDWQIRFFLLLRDYLQIKPFSPVILSFSSVIFFYLFRYLPSMFPETMQKSLRVFSSFGYYNSSLLLISITGVFASLFFTSLTKLGLL